MSKSVLTHAAAQLLRVLPRGAISRAAGQLADFEWPAPLGSAVIKAYSWAYDVDLGEAVSEPWRNFDAFFTRPLREGVRPLATDPRTVLSPADGRLDSIGRVEPGALYRVKGQQYRVEDLVGDAEDAKRYEGGAGCVIYLSPRDYHRVHSPVSGVVTEVRSLPGDYFPVNSIGLRHVPRLFVVNRRVAIVIDTPKESGLGRVTVVMVAAIVVGRVTVAGLPFRDVPPGRHRPERPISVLRGAEIGRFHLGSTAVLFLEPRAAGPWLAGEGPIRMGEALCRATGETARREG